MSPLPPLGTAQVVDLDAWRKAKAPQLFKPRPFAADDFRNMHGGLAAMAGMVDSGLLADPGTIAALLRAYSTHARLAEMTADETLSRAAKAERRVRQLERQAKRTAGKGGAQ